MGTSKKLSATATTSGHSNMCGSLFSEVEVEVSTSGSLDVGVTSDAKVSGKAESPGNATFYGDASISGVTQTTGGSAHKGSKCKAMKPLPDFPLGLTESSGVIISTSFPTESPGLTESSGGIISTSFPTESPGLTESSGVMLSTSFSV